MPRIVRKKLPRKITKLKSGVRAHPDAEPGLVEYSRVLPRRYAKWPVMGWWMDPTGKTHEVPGLITHDEWIQEHMFNHPSLKYDYMGSPGLSSEDDSEPFRDHAYNKGWQRLVHIPAAKTLVVENNKVKPNAAQMEAIGNHALSIGADKTEMYHPLQRKSKMKDFLSRKVIPRRFAKVDGDVPAHHLIAGFPIEHALRHLANDPKNPDNIRSTAVVALTGKNQLTGEDSGVGPALWALSDALHEHRNEDGTGHPMADTYNWMSAADKIHLDGHTHTALAEEGHRLRKEHNQPDVTPSNWAYRPEGSATRVSTHVDHDQLDRVIARVKKLSKVNDDYAINESLQRHAHRAQMIWNKEHGIKQRIESDRNRSILPIRPTFTEKERVSRYSRDKGDRGYSWMEPGGKYHPVVGMDTHDKMIRRLGFKDSNEAYGKGWLRVVATGGMLYVHNPVKQPSMNQRQYLIDHALEDRYEGVVHDNGKNSRVLWDSQDRLSRRGSVPIRMSSAVRGDFIDSLRRVRSSNITTLNTVARQVAMKLGLHPTKSMPALHDNRQGSVPGIAQAVYGNASPEQIHTAASWLGSVGNLPGVMVHHIRPGGPDTLYKFRQVGSGLDIRHKLDRAGLTDRVIAIPQGELSKTGFDIMIPDKGNRLRQVMASYAKQHGVQVQSSQGYIRTMGSQDQGAARDKYRGQIAKSEQMARQGEATQYAVPKGWYVGRKGIPHAKLMKWLKEYEPNELALMPGRNPERIGLRKTKSGDIDLQLGGWKVLTIKPDGTYELVSQTPNTRHSMTWKNLINGFVGTNAATVKRGMVHINGKPLQEGQVLTPQNRSLANWWNQVIKQNGDVDYAAAGALADRLEEQGDWRHHLVRKLAKRDNVRSLFKRPLKSDGTPELTHADREDGTYEPVETIHSPEWQTRRYLPDSQGRIVYGHQVGYVPEYTPNRPTIRIITGLTKRGEPKTTKRGIALFTPGEYEAMRQDALKTGVVLPTPPLSHQPQEPVHEEPEEPDHPDGPTGGGVYTGDPGEDRPRFKRKVKICRS